MSIKYSKLLTCVVLAMSCCNFGCREVAPEYTTISLHNESDEVIYACGSSRLEETLTPEVAFSSQDYDVGELIPIYPHKSYFAIMSYRFGNDNNQILIFKECTIKQYTTDELIHNNIYDKYYKLSSYEIECMGYKIVYTGD